MASNHPATPSCWSLEQLQDLAEFDCIIDVRSPAEFDDDHIPGAVNFPVLDDLERVQIGTLHKQNSAFEAKRLGAALVAANIGRHLHSPFFQNQPISWRPLICCWRGGKRSGALNHILRQIGWKSLQLAGGWRSYRHAVLNATEPASLAALQLRFIVIAGRTGSGKSLLLERLCAAGAQTLDLEQLACHKGSVLGADPNQPQPSQKWFESMLLARLNSYQTDRPVFVESESKKVGQLRIPEGLMAQIRASDCIHLHLSLENRVSLLGRQYPHFIAAPQTLMTQLEHLKSHHGAKRLDEWQAWSDAGQWQNLVAALLCCHYDPGYDKSILRNFAKIDQARRIDLPASSPSALDAVAAQLIALYR